MNDADLLILRSAALNRTARANEALRQELAAANDTIARLRAELASREAPCRTKHPTSA